MTYITAILATLLILTACNNDRTARLNAGGYADPKNDVTLDLTEKEAKVFTSVELPEDERLTAVSFIATVELIDKNEDKIFANLAGVIAGPNATVSITGTRGLSINSALSTPASFTLPVRNGSGTFTEIEITIEGKAGENPNLPFATVTSEIITPVESDADDSEVAPQPFSSYFAEDETAVYQRTKGKDKENEFFYHIINEDLGEGLIKATVRMTLNKVLTEEEAN